VLLADSEEKPRPEEAAVALLSHQVQGLLLRSSRLVLRGTVGPAPGRRLAVR
jgi:hypothetical protein